MTALSSLAACPTASNIGPGGPGGDTTDASTCVASERVPTEKPTSPTVCTASNQGCCDCATGDSTTYVFWESSSTQQRCFTVSNIPTPPTSNSDDDDDDANSHSHRIPVVIFSRGYGNGAQPQITPSNEAAAKYYNFAGIAVSSPYSDGAGAFGLEFGNNGIANSTHPRPCSDADSRDMPYLRTVLAFIESKAAVLDTSRVFTMGFSQESMFSAYMAICFPDKIKGMWQGGSGLAKTGFAPIVPGYQAQCARTSNLESGGDCCTTAFCHDCEYWPAYPRTSDVANANTLVDCIMAYVDDDTACGSDLFMYEAMVAEGHDARMLSFPIPAGMTQAGHRSPYNEWAWKASCLGLSAHCSSQCETSFATCIDSAATGSTGMDKFEVCETELKAGSLTGCTIGCAPTLTMLQTSEQPVVSLSAGAWGVGANSITGLTTASNPPPAPACTNDIGAFASIPSSSSSLKQCTATCATGGAGSCNTVAVPPVTKPDADSGYCSCGTTGLPTTSTVNGTAAAVMATTTSTTTTTTTRSPTTSTNATTIPTPTGDVLLCDESTGPRFPTDDHTYYQMCPVASCLPPDKFPADCELKTTYYLGAGGSACCENACGGYVHKTDGSACVAFTDDRPAACPTLACDQCPSTCRFNPSNDETDATTGCPKHPCGICDCTSATTVSVPDAEEVEANNNDNKADNNNDPTDQHTPAGDGSAFCGLGTKFISGRCVADYKSVVAACGTNADELSFECANLGSGNTSPSCHGHDHSQAR
eukprot:g1124.t1